MSVRRLLQQPPWLPRSLDNTYYVGVSALRDRAWDTIFDSLSKYPEFRNGFLDIGDEDVRTCIRRRLAVLLPDSDYQYTPDQVSVWTSLVASPLTVRTEDLQKVIAMEDLRYASVPEQSAEAPDSRGFLLYSWVMSVSELNLLFNYLKKEEKTVRELITWDNSIADNKLGPDDRIFIRYIGSHAISEWPIDIMSSLYNETEHPRSGILADFLPALLCVLPTVAASCQCHRIQHIVTSTEDEEGFHELIHSTLIEFFGAAFVLNRHPDKNASEWLSERKSMLADLFLRLDHGVLKQELHFLGPVATKLRRHFDKMQHYVTRDLEVAGIDDNSMGLSEATCATLLWQSMSPCYKHDTAIMVVAARSMHINDYKNGRAFSRSHDPSNQLIGHLLGHVKDTDVRALAAQPFAYYCLAPWTKHDCLDYAVVTLGKEMAGFVVSKCGYCGPYTTDTFMEELGQPVARVIGNHHFIHVPLLDPSRCRYGVDEVDEVAQKFMQTSFWNAMVVADSVLEAIDDWENIVEEMPPDEEEDLDSESICGLTMGILDQFYEMPEAKVLLAELDEDFTDLVEMVEKEPLFIP
ncbi:hypothetical protein F5Y10DRAFT_280300 [Nemania abortiva]|nr:hypothetical protein F5Y10DRAFT_280300 [Nemania abortiva]